MQTIPMRELEWLHKYQAKIELKTRNVARDKKSYFLFSKRSIHQKDTTIITIKNAHILQRRDAMYTKQNLENERRNRQLKFYRWRFQYFTLIIGTIRNKISKATDL